MENVRPSLLPFLPVRVLTGTEHLPALGVFFPPRDVLEVGKNTFESQRWFARGAAFGVGLKHRAGLLGKSGLKGWQLCARRTEVRAWPRTGGTKLPCPRGEHRPKLNKSSGEVQGERRC